MIDKAICWQKDANICVLLKTTLLCAMPAEHVNLVSSKTFMRRRATIMAPQDNNLSR